GAGRRDERSLRARPRGPDRPRRTLWPGRELAALEVAREEREVLHLHGRDAVSRQPRDGVARPGEADREREAGDDHGRRRGETANATHFEPPWWLSRPGGFPSGQVPTRATCRCTSARPEVHQQPCGSSSRGLCCSACG